uniref:Amidase domain-containing protein n=1 Tax=Rhizochromulina marina TaxID=1034831 RepID=A0A7S2SUD1_9STRA|mmetsp:Transcript_7191/g.20789  ORF Transcript_7191/g.20789 Transcript_7191/m.20789 type:complete len:646 (+) Transcript_7191:1-1938(+)
MQGFYLGFLVATALFCLLLAAYRGGEVSLVAGQGSSLGDLTYDVSSLAAPAATGHKLRLLSYLLTQSAVGPIIRRILLNKNHVEELRYAAAQMPHVMEMDHPIYRMQPDERRDYEAMATSGPDLSTVLREGLGGFSETERLHSAYRSGRVTPSEVLGRVVRAVEQSHAPLRIFSSFNSTDVFDQARASTERYAADAPLSIFDGVPIAVKDMLHVKGHITTHGTPARHPQWRVQAQQCDASDDWQSTSDLDREDVLVRRFRDLGAVILGVTVMTEGGVTPLGWSVAAQGPANPHGVEGYSGGSSGGSAVAVASGLTPISIGFDGGGSIRIPASMSGVVGLAPSFGRVPYEPDNIGATMIKGGPLAATVMDAALAYAVIAPSVPNHFYSILYDNGERGPPSPHLSGVSEAVAGTTRMDLAGVRLGIYWEHFNDSDEDVTAACLEAVQALEKRGAEVVPIRIPHLGLAGLAHGITISSEFAIDYDLLYHASKVPLEPNTRITVGLGSSVTALEVRAAAKLRSWMFSFVTRLFQEQQLDAIITPTIATRVPLFDREAQTFGESNTPLVMAMMRYVNLGNLIGLPGVSIPVGRDVNGFPIGLLVTTRHWHEHTALRIAGALEADPSIQTRLAPQGEYRFDWDSAGLASAA